MDDIVSLDAVGGECDIVEVALASRPDRTNAGAHFAHVRDVRRVPHDLGERQAAAVTPNQLDRLRPSRMFAP